MYKPVPRIQPVGKGGMGWDWGGVGRVGGDEDGLRWGVEGRDRVERDGVASMWGLRRQACKGARPLSEPWGWQEVGQRFAQQLGVVSVWWMDGG